MLTAAFVRLETAWSATPQLIRRTACRATRQGTAVFRRTTVIGRLRRRTPGSTFGSATLPTLLGPARGHQRAFAPNEASAAANGERLVVQAFARSLERREKRPADVFDMHQRPPR